MFNRVSEQVNKVKNLTLKPSRFNVISQSSNYVKLYNSFTGKIVKFNGGYKESLLNTLRDKEIHYRERERLVDFLADEKFLINSDINEYRRQLLKR